MSDEDKSNLKSQLTKEVDTLVLSNRKLLDKITKNDVNTLKMYKMPNEQIIMSGDGLSVLLGKPTGWNEFRSYIDLEIINELRSFDYKSISSKTMKKLSKYVENEEFKEAALSNYSELSKKICQWTLNTYNLNLKNEQVIISYYHYYQK